MDVIVTPVNDAPVLEEIGYQEMLEDTELTLSIIAEDVDGDSLIFDATSGSPLNLSVSVTGNELIMIPADDFNGEVTISVSVTDGEYYDNTSFILNVLPVNDAPTIELPESFTFDEDGSLAEDFSDYLNDIDEDALTLTVSGNDSITVDINDFVVTFASAQDWNGTETLTFTVNEIRTGQLHQTLWM